MLGRHEVGSRFLGAGRSLARPYVEASASISASATVSAPDPSVGRTASASVTASATATLGPGDIVRPASASVTATATATAAPSNQARASASVSAAATATANGSALRPAASGVTAIATAAANARIARPASANITSQAIATANGNRTAFASGSVTGQATASANASRGANASASITGTATATANGQFPPATGRVVILVPERQKTIPVPERRRTIEYVGDDKEIFVEEFTKQPSEVIDYLLDMRQFFKRIRSDGIDTISISISPSGTSGDLESAPGGLPAFDLVGDAPSHQALIWLGGGRDGTTYQVTAVVTTTVGRVEEVDFLIIVEDE